MQWRRSPVSAARAKHIHKNIHNREMKKSSAKTDEAWLLALLKSTLWSAGSDLGSIGVAELRRVLSLAAEHTVAALAANAVTSGRVAMENDGSPLRGQTVGAMLHVEQMHRAQYARFCKLLHELAALFRTYDIHYLVFKGVAVASHYDKPWLRTMGDIDFYVAPADFERAIRTIEKEWNVSIERDETDKHYNFDWQGVRFEMHHRIETFGRKGIQRQFDSWMEDTAMHNAATISIDGCQICVLPPVADVAVVFKHMMNHLLVEGVGLRQVADVAVLLYSYKNSIDVGRLRARLDALGYIGAFDAVVAMLDRYLGLPCAKLYAPLKKKDADSAAHLFRFVMESGNFGRKAYAGRCGGWRKSVLTAARAFGHCMFAFRLMPMEIVAFVARRTGISIKKNFCR